MTTEQPSLPNKDELTQHILRFIAGYGPNLERRMSRPAPEPHMDEPFISIEAGGVRVNTLAGWFHYDTPFLVLSLLHLLEVPILNRDEVVAWVKGQQRPAGYFKGDGLGLFADDSTYHACVLLRWLGAVHEEHGWRRSKLVERLRVLQRPGERHMFGHLPAVQESCTDATYTLHAIACLAALDETVPDPRAAIRYIKAKQEAHGAFAYGWTRYYRDVPDVWATLAALRCLALLGAGPMDPRACVRAMQRWQKPDGGFSTMLPASPGTTVTGNASETGATLVALCFLGGDPLDPDACRRRLAHLWSPDEGGFKYGTHPSLEADLQATHSAVLGMAAFGLLGPVRPHWREAFLFSYR